MNILALIIALLLATPAAAAPSGESGPRLHHHKGMSSEIDRFYSFWLQPNGGNKRVSSCCSGQDCYPVEIKSAAGRYWFKHRETGRWMIVPDNRVESLQPDPRESPDGRSHVCANEFGHVHCFVAGSAI